MSDCENHSKEEALDNGLMLGYVKECRKGVEKILEENSGIPERFHSRANELLDRMNQFILNSEGKDCSKEPQDIVARELRESIAMNLLELTYLLWADIKISQGGKTVLSS